MGRVLAIQHGKQNLIPRTHKKVECRNTGEADMGTFSGNWWPVRDVLNTLKNVTERERENRGKDRKKTQHQPVASTCKAHTPCTHACTYTHHTTTLTTTHTHIINKLFVFLSSMSMPELKLRIVTINTWALYVMWLLLKKTVTVRDAKQDTKRFDLAGLEGVVV